MARGRAVKRKEPHDTWKACRDARGQWVVMDRDGREPLRSPDPIVRIRAVHLAAQAPELRADLRGLMEFVERLMLYNVLSPRMHEEAQNRIAAAAYTMGFSRAPFEEERAIVAEQQEIDLAA